MKNSIRILTLADLMLGHITAEIICPIKQIVVRKLAIKETGLVIDFTGEILTASLNQPVFYDPWFMDRGSLVIQCKQSPNGRAQLCTEMDIIRYEDGSEASILPHPSCLRSKHAVKVNLHTAEGVKTIETESDPNRGGIF